MKLSPFHLAIPVHDLASTRAFYRDVLGCAEGRSDAHWVDLDLFGHQLVLHEVVDARPRVAATNPVDGDEVPVPHFGVGVAWDDWRAVSERLMAAQISFVIAPHVRFEGEIGEQATLFFLDPSGNALEFKSFKDMDQLFAAGDERKGLDA